MSTAESPLFNSLGQILGRGGEIAVARAILRGVSVDELIATFRKRFAPVQDDTLESLFSVAGRAIGAGELWQALPRDLKPDGSIFPVNPYLFGDEWAGKRVLAVATVDWTEQEKPFDVWFDLPDFTPFGELEELIEERIADFIKKYEEKAKRLGMDVVRQIIVHNLIAEKRY
jgi:hypothetical protein